MQCKLYTKYRQEKLLEKFILVEEHTDKLFTFPDQITNIIVDKEEHPNKDISSL